MQSTLAHPFAALPSSSRRVAPVERPALAPSATPPEAAPRRLSSLDLLDGGREVEIEHAGAIYRLRRTALGKLILTK